MSFPPWVFYELSAGLAVTKVNQVLGIIREEIENETGKKPSCLYGLGGQKYSFVLLGGQKTQSTWRWHQLRVTKEYCVRLGENNLKTTRYWKSKVCSCPNLIPPHASAYGTVRNQMVGQRDPRPELIQLFPCPNFSASATHNKLSVNNPTETGTCQRYTGTHISVSVKWG